MVGRRKSKEWANSGEIQTRAITRLDNGFDVKVEKDSQGRLSDHRLEQVKATSMPPHSGWPPHVSQPGLERDSKCALWIPFIRWNTFLSASSCARCTSKDTLQVSPTDYIFITLFNESYRMQAIDIHFCVWWKLWRCTPLATFKYAIHYQLQNSCCTLYPHDWLIL